MKLFKDHTYRLVIKSMHKVTFCKLLLTIAWQIRLWMFLSCAINTTKIGDSGLPTSTWMAIHLLQKKVSMNRFLQLVTNVKESSFHLKVIKPKLIRNDQRTRFLRFETWFLDWKQNFYTENKIFKLKIGFLLWKQE